jgi:uncharacterized membrane protein YecN with MAPEG domain
MRPAALDSFVEVLEQIQAKLCSISMVGVSLRFGFVLLAEGLHHRQG